MAPVCVIDKRMKPQARIEAVTEIMDRIADARVPMDSAVGDYMRPRRYIGSKDRAFIAEYAYDMMRHHARLGWWCQRLNVRDCARNRVICYLALVRKNSLARFKDLYDGSEHAPDRLNDDELALINTLTSHDGTAHKDMPLPVLCECPPDYTDVLSAYFGDDFQAEMEAMMHAATLDLRVNTFTCDLEKAAAALAKDGVETTRTPLSPYGLRCVNKAYLSKTKAFNKGWVEIQDEGSQMIAHLCAARPGMQVLDFCAGGGGKTLALASAMQRKGRIVAMDNDSSRLEKGRRRYKKAGIADIVEVRSLEDERNRKWLRRQKEKFDVVLLDVPCSGSGTWRRNPDMRWKNYGPDLDELTAIQSDILERACAAVKPGGHLVYATCSLLPAENEDRIAAFLATHPEFGVVPVDPDLGIGSPYMRLTPHRHNTDGFFTAILCRQ